MEFTPLSSLSSQRPHSYPLQSWTNIPLLFWWTSLPTVASLGYQDCLALCGPHVLLSQAGYQPTAVSDLVPEMESRHLFRGVLYYNRIPILALWITNSEAFILPKETWEGENLIWSISYTCGSSNFHKTFPIMSEFSSMSELVATFSWVWSSHMLNNLSLYKII